MLGLVQLQATIAEVREAYGNDALRLAGLVLTKVSRNNVARDVEAELRSRFGAAGLRRDDPAVSAKIEEAHTRGQTVMEYAPRSAGALAYAQLVEEIEHGRAKGGGGVEAVGGPRAVDADADAA